MRKTYLYTIAVFSLFLTSCREEAAQQDKQPILEVEGRFLYTDDLDEIIPRGIPEEDSVTLAQAYIRKWVTDVLLYENAQRNLSNKEEIDELVEEYRRSLTIFNYEQRMVEQRLKLPTDEEVTQFYEANKSEFTLTENVMRGAMVIVSKNAPRLDVVRNGLRCLDDKSLEQIEKYSIENNATFDYFQDKWYFFNDILKKMPLQVVNQSDFITRQPFFELQDSLYSYMLRITDYRLVGSPAPLDMVQERVRTQLYNKNKIEYLKNFERELFDDAKRSGDITFLKTEK